MTRPDPSSVRVCRRCGRPVLRVHDAEIRLHIDLDPDPLPITRTLTPGDPVYEYHPRLSWVCQFSPQRRGFPLHHMHTCPRQPSVKARAA